MKSDCVRTRDHVSDLISGTLPETDERTLREHLNTCAECRRYVQALEQEDASLTDHFAQIDADMAARQAHVLCAIEEMPGFRPRGVLLIGREFLRNPMAGIAAVVAVVGIVVLFTLRDVPREPRVIPHPGATMSAAEMLTVGQLKAAYARGGLEEFEAQCEKAAERVNVQPMQLSIEDVIAEIEGT